MQGETGHVIIGAPDDNKLEPEAAHQLTIFGDVKTHDTIFAEVVNTPYVTTTRIVSNARTNAPSILTNVLLSDDTAMFGSGFRMDNISDNKRDAEIIIRKDGIFKSKPITGEISINSDADVVLTEKIIEDRHIKNKLDIKNKTTIKLGPGLSWGIDDKTIQYSLLDQQIVNRNISDDARINMSKTLFNVNADQFEYDPNVGKLEN